MPTPDFDTNLKNFKIFLNEKIQARVSNRLLAIATDEVVPNLSSA